jgi:hypothetical protein
MSDRARLFAEGLRLTGEVGDTLLVFQDGYALAVAASADRHLALRKGLRAFCPVVEEGRSSDGFLSAFIVPDEAARGVRLDPFQARREGDSDRAVPPWVAAGTDGYKGPRQSHFPTLAAAEGLFRRVVAREQGKSR